MPFISKDWRSPGEEWVKYDGGWEKKSIVTINDKDLEQIAGHLDLVVGQNSANQSLKSVCNANVKFSQDSSSATVKRKKNLSESCEVNNKENQNPVEYHRLLLQEHIRRIRRNLRPEEVSENQLQPNQAQDENQQKNNRFLLFGFCEFIWDLSTVFFEII